MVLGDFEPMASSQIATKDTMRQPCRSSSRLDCQCHCLPLKPKHGYNQLLIGENISSFTDLLENLLLKAKVRT